MLDNISKEIFYYSVIPIIVITVISLLLLIIGKTKNNNYYKYNYAIKVLLTILISLILSLMIGYTIWFYQRTINMGTISQNMLFIILLAVLVISLFLSLIILFFKLHKDFKLNNAQKKEFQSE